MGREAGPDIMLRAASKDNPGCEPGHGFGQMYLLQLSAQSAGNVAPEAITMTKPSSSPSSLGYAQQTPAPDDEETSPLPIIDLENGQLTAGEILHSLGHQLQELLVLGRSINANLEKLAQTGVTDADPSKNGKRRKKKK